MNTTHTFTYNGFSEWCAVEECAAPIIHGVPLCHHEQPDAELAQALKGEDLAAFELAKTVEVWREEILELVGDKIPGLAEDIRRFQQARSRRRNASDRVLG